MEFNEEKEKIKELLDALTDEQRYDIFTDYCLGCGAIEPPKCYCRYDD